MKVLRKIKHELQNEINIVIDRLLSECKTEYDNEGISGFIADVRRGLAYMDGRFTVPLWAYDRRNNGKNYRGDEGYFVYYVAHELSHQLRYKKYGLNGGHDFRFYEIFIDVCPKEYQHFELNYKKTSSKFGIIQTI